MCALFIMAKTDTSTQRMPDFFFTKCPRNAHQKEQTPDVMEETNKYSPSVDSNSH